MGSGAVTATASVVAPCSFRALRGLVLTVLHSSSLRSISICSSSDGSDDIHSSALDVSVCTALDSDVSRGCTGKKPLVSDPPWFPFMPLLSRRCPLPVRP